MTTEAQYVAELENLRSQSFWKGWSVRDLQAIAAISLGGGGGGGGGSMTIQLVQNLAPGANTIVHNLNLPPPFISTKTIVDNATGMPILVRISGDSANSFMITSPIAYPNVRITVKS